MFQASFRLEVAATEALSRLRALRPASVVEHAPHALLKELLRGETLQKLILRGALTDSQRASLIEALREAADISKRLGSLMDLSPKNLCWQDGWVLLDAGPKTHVTDYGALLEDPGWEPYVRYFERKGSLAPGGSAPSVLSRAPSVLSRARSVLAGRAHFAAFMPLSRRDGPLGELLCLPSGNCQRALLFVPGFRASFEAQAPLVQALMDRGVEGLFVMSYLGVRTRSGQAQVTGGR